MQDKTGNIWFSTNNGISKFDGYHFDIFNNQNGLLDNDVFFSNQDSKGRIWIFTSNGKTSIYSNKKILNEINYPKLSLLKTNTWFTSFVEDKNGNIWLSSIQDYIFKIDSNFKITKYKLTNQEFFASKLFINTKNEIFIFSPYGLHKFNINKFQISQKIKRTPGEAIKFFNLPNNQFLQSKKDTLYLLDKNLKTISKIKSSLITNILEQNKNTFYISDNKSLYKLKIQNKKLFKVKISTISNISSIKYIDGNIYCISTLDIGCKISTSNKLYGLKNIFKNYFNIYSIHSNKNNIYFGGKYGQFAILSKDKFKIVSILSSILSYGEGKISDISNFYNNLISISFEQRFTVFDNNKLIYIFPYHAKSSLTTNKFLYIASSTNIVEIPKDSITKLTLKFKSENNSIKIEHAETNISRYSKKPWIRTNKIILDSNNIIICSNKGLFKLKSGTKILDSSLQSAIPKLKYPIKTIFKISYNNYLISIPGFGLYILLDNNFSSIKDNLLTNNTQVSKIVKYNSESIWLCSNNGLYKIDLLEKKTNYEIVRFTINDGLLSNEVNDITYSQGKWWVATSGGVTVFDEAYFKTKNEIPPKVVFRELLLNGSTTISDDRPLVEGNTRVKFSVGCLSFKHFRNIRFRYKLHSRDYWRYSMDFDQELTDLSRGNYQIQIQARSPFSPWSRSIILPAFTILPPFWERWWVQYLLFVGGVILFGILVFTGYKVRVTRIRMRNQLIDANLTALRAQIRPHFIANIINSVQIYFLNNKKEDAIVFLGTFGKMVRRILDTSEEEFITVSEELKQIREYLDFECRRTSRKIDYEIRFPDDMNMNYIYLPTMLLQPILENAIIHGLQVGEITEGSVEIQFLFIQEKEEKLAKNEYNISREGRMLVSISDTGIGRAASAMKKHSSSRSFGVKSIQNRLKWISEKFDCEAFAIIEDLKDKNEEPAGTMVTLNLPLFVKDPIAEIDQSAS